MTVSSSNRSIADHEGILSIDRKEKGACVEIAYDLVKDTEREGL